MTRVLITGSSRYGTVEAVAAALRPYRNLRPLTDPSPHKIIVLNDGVVSDRAREWAQVSGVPFRLFVSNPKRDGIAAAAVRNSRAIKEGKLDIVLVLGRAKDWDIGVRALDAGIEVREILPKPRWAARDIRRHKST